MTEGRLTPASVMLLRPLFEGAPARASSVRRLPSIANAHFSKDLNHLQRARAPPQLVQVVPGIEEPAGRIDEVLRSSENWNPHVLRESRPDPIYRFRVDRVRAVDI